MIHWLSRNPFTVLLVPLVTFIVCGTYWQWPIVYPKTVTVPENDTARTFYTICLRTEAMPRSATMRYEATVLDSVMRGAHVLVYMRGDSTCHWPKQGDTLLVYTAWQKPDSMNGWNYAAYLRRQGISATGFVDSWAWQVINSNHSPWWRSSAAWQNRLKSRYQMLGIHGRELATICALTLGYREDLEPQLRRQFSAAGAMHVLAVSGLHTNILMMVLMAILTLFGWRKPLYEERVKQYILGMIIILSLMAYAWLTGATPSVVRAVIMSSILLLAMMVRRTNQILNTVFASAFIILVFRPMDLFSVSFQLSFAAVLAIVLFVPGWNRVMPQDHVWSLIGVSVAATMGTLPITLYYYGQISNYFLLTNLIVLPLAWVMMIGGFATLTVGWITPLGKVLAWIVNGTTWLMNAGVGWLEHLPYSTTQTTLPLWGMWTLVAVNLILLFMWDRITQTDTKNHVDKYI